MEHGPFQYRFASEPSRRRFADDPGRYSIQNETCLVAPGTPLDPELFAVYEQKVYGFATAGCVDEFEREPTAYLGR